MKIGFTERLSFVLAALFFAALTVSGFAGSAMAADDTVTAVKGDTIVFYTTQGNFWYGTKVQVGFKTPDGEVVPVGSWSVDRIKDEDEDRRRITACRVESQAPADAGYHIEFVELKHQDRIAWLRQAADAGCGGALFDLASAYQFGSDAVEKDINRAVELMRKAANMGHPSAQYEMHSILQRQWMANNSDRIADAPSTLRERRYMWLERAAENGNPHAQKTIGTKYLTEKKLDKAEYWYRRAADSKPPFSKEWEPLTDLAKYLDMFGYKEKALAIYRQSAQAGGGKAQEELKKRGVAW
jgi:tetratricopeptide (TPR) repeat protein